MIDHINKIAEIWWNWMWPMFWQVSILICFVGAVDFILRKYIWPQVRYALWLLVLVKLILPPSFALPTGVLSHIQPFFERSSQQNVSVERSVPYELVDEYGNSSGLSTLPVMHPELTESTGVIESTDQIETSNSTRINLSLHAIAMIVWMLVTILLMLRLFVRHSLLMKANYDNKSDYNLPEWFPQLLNNIAEKLHFRKMPRIVLSSTINCPAVFGIFKPVLLIPAEKIGRMSQEEVEHILLHELAHIKRRDLPIHALCVHLQIFYWFNPLLILVRRQLQHLRELCCDAMVIEILKDKAEAYSQTILNTVEWLVNRSRYHGIGLLGLIEDPCRLRIRLEYLKKKPSKYPNLRIATASILMLTMFTFILPMAKAERSNQTDEIVSSDNISESSTEQEGMHYETLLEAVEAGDLEEVKRLVAEGADLNAFDKEDEMTPLAAAALEGHVEIVKTLLDSGAKVDIGNSFGCTPLWFAVMSHDEDTVNVLISSGANVNLTPEMEDTPLNYAIWNDQTSIVRSLLDAGADSEKEDLSGMSPLQNALSVGNPDIVKLLVETDDKVPELHRAALKGDLEGMKKLLEDGADINDKDEFDRTPIEYALAAGQNDATKLLLDQGIDINLKLTRERPLLNLAARAGLEEIVQILIARDVLLDTVPRNGYTALHEAVWGGHKEIAELLISEGIPIDSKDIINRTPLHVAVEVGETDIVELLIAKGADINASGYQDRTPLDVAVQRGRTKIAELLHGHGAEENFSIEDDSISSLAILEAAEMGDLEKVKSLIESGVDVNIKNDGGWTPLYMASNGGHLEVAKLLIDKGANVNTSNNWGWTPLHAATISGNQNIVELLLAKGANVNAKRIAGWTALHLAVAGGRSDIVELLLNNDADVNIKKDDGLTPLDVAQQQNYTEIVELLREHGAEQSSSDEDGDAEPPNSLYEAVETGDLAEVQRFIDEGADVNATQASSRTALHAAAENGNKDVAEFLLNSGADINVKSDGGTTPLFLASGGNLGLNGYIDVVELLVTKGADVNIATDFGWTPLHIAVSIGNKEIAEILIDAGANVNAKRWEGWTPLHQAAAIGHKNLVELLINSGVDVNATNNTGGTALDMAQQGSHTEIVELLREHGAEEVSSVDEDDDAVSQETEAATEQEEEHYESLIEAAQAGNLDEVKRLIDEGANINATGQYNYTPLYFAIINSDKDMVNFLLSKGADANIKTVIADFNSSLLYYAIITKDLDIIKLLVDHGAKFDVKDENGWTDLHYAAEGGQLSSRDIVEFFISKIIDTSNLYMAAFTGDLTRIQELIEQGIDIDTKDEAGWTALFWAASAGQTDVAEFLINNGADVNVKITIPVVHRGLMSMGNDSDYSPTPLHQAAKIGELDLVKLLISKGSDINANDPQGRTPLYFTAFRGDLEVVEYLLSVGADVNGNSGGNTSPLTGGLLNSPLFGAIMEGHVDVVELLLEKGADVNASLGRGGRGVRAGRGASGSVTLLDIAEQRGQTEIVELLRKHGAEE